MINSLAYAALVAIVAGLGYLTFQAVTASRDGAEQAAKTREEPDVVPLVEIDGFVTREERTADTRRLTISARLRINAQGKIDSFVFVVARNDRVTPKAWTVWPTQTRGSGSMTAGGHFYGNNPSAGWAMSLTTNWTRLTASLDYPPGQAPYETVILYVVDSEGRTLLARPFQI